MKPVPTSNRPPVPGRKAGEAIQRREQAVAARQRRYELWAAAAILIVACLLRLLFLDLKPLHHDEGVNGLFMTNLFRTGYYHYDPANYHGPTLYYFGLVTTTLNAIFYGKAGLSTFAVRLVPAVFGISLVGLVFSLRSHLGGFGAVAAAALLAVSPGMVYFSRYFIHEIPFVFLTLALVVTTLRYRETGQPKYMMLASASAALMFATKETCIISFAVLALAWVCMQVYLSMRKRLSGTAAIVEPPPQKADERAGKPRWTTPVLAVLVFLSIWLVFYSSFFTNSKGLLDSLRTFQIWTHTGVQTETYRAPWPTYLNWLGQEDLPILALGGLGIIIALWKARDRFSVFAAFWAMGITAAYTLVPYKTPWLALNLILPLALAAGYGLNQCVAAGTFFRIGAFLVLPAAVGGSLYQAIDISFFRYDDNSFPYIYAHTNRELLELVDEVEAIAARSPSGKNTGMTIVSDVYWPLPWYLREYPRALFWGKIVPTSEPILICSGEQSQDVEQQFGRSYRLYKAYDLRQGNMLVLYLRRDVRP